MDNHNQNKKSDVPFFIIGSVRSGTTVLRLIMGHHSKVCSCIEMDYITPALKFSHNLAINLGEYIEFLKHDRQFQSSRFIIRNKENFVDLVSDFFEQLYEVEFKPKYGAVVHHDFDKLPLIWPEAKFIHILRDPRDVACSSVKMGWGGTPWQASKIWVDAYNCYLKLKEIVKPDKIYTIRFESLVDNPKNEISKVCNFLGISFEPEMLNIAKDTTYSNISSDVAKTWKNNASKNHISQVESYVDGLLASAGYSHSGYPQMNKTFVNITKLRLLSAINRKLFMIRRYGICLTVMDFISRKLAIRSLAISTKSKMDVITNRHEK